MHGTHSQPPVGATPAPAAERPASHVSFIAAVGTPLTPEQQLHERGLQLHLEDCWGAGMSGVLVAGTMGLLQLLAEDTYRRLVERSLSLSRGCGEVMIGAGDTSFARTRDRIAFLNRFELDGVVILPPYFVTFEQEELIGYYQALAGISKAPVYLYDLPARTRTKLTLDTVLTLARHPNVRGIKVSADAAYARQLMDLADPSFRVIMADPDLIDVFVAYGFREHLDGMYGLAPSWVAAIGHHAAKGNRDEAASYQRKLTQLKQTLIPHRVFPAFTAIMNARGIPGNFSPAPYRPLSADEEKVLLSIPVVKELTCGEPLIPH